MILSRSLSSLAVDSVHPTTPGTRSPRTRQRLRFRRVATDQLARLQPAHQPELEPGIQPQVRRGGRAASPIVRPARLRPRRLGRQGPVQKPAEFGGVPLLARSRQARIPARITLRRLGSVRCRGRRPLASCHIEWYAACAKISLLPATRGSHSRRPSRRRQLQGRPALRELLFPATRIRCCGRPTRTPVAACDWRPLRQPRNNPTPHRTPLRPGPRE